MILETIEHKEFYSNGQAFIVGRIGIVAPMWQHLYDIRKFDINGTPCEPWCRIGKWIKYYDNGQVAWSIEYDEYGFFIRDNK